MLSALVVVSAPLWVRAIGTFLVDADPARKADAAVVLAGDGYGKRILAAAELARRGMVPTVYVSGPRGHFGFTEDELAIAYAVKSGFPASYFRGVPHSATSTREEAPILAAVLRRAGVRTADIVTSDYHTRRSKRIFREIAPDIEMAFVAAPDTLFDIQYWWRAREGRKTIFMEWTKTVAEWMGL